MQSVLLDVDGVLANFNEAALKSLVDIGGPQIHPEDIKTWDMFGSIPYEWEDRLIAEWHKPGWCAGIPQYEGAFEAVLALRERAKVLFVTAAMTNAPHWMWERDCWLRQHMNAGGKDVIFAAAKSHVVGDIFVDDKTSNVIEWHNAHPKGKAILWDQPFNTADKTPSGILRTNSWDTVLNLLNPV